MPRSDMSNGMSEGMARASETAQRATSQMLSLSQQSMLRWRERRDRSVDAWVECVSASLRADTPMDVMNAWMNWCTGAVSRLSDDAREQVRASTAIVRDAAGEADKMAHQAKEFAEGAQARMANAADQAADAADDWEGDEVEDEDGGDEQERRVQPH
jgi:hypothetical protein